MIKRILLKKLTPYYFAAPAVIYLLLMLIYPLFYSFHLSLHKIRLYQLTGKGVFVGLANYIDLLNYPRFWNSLFVTLKFLVISLGFEFVLGLSIALLLNTQLKARRLFRSIAIMPLMLTPVVLGINFKMIFNYLYGLANWVVSLFGLDPIQWLSDPFWGMTSVVITEVWNQTPFVTLILLAGLQSIPLNLYEAARVDGANRLRVLWHITLPMLMPMIFVVIFWRSVALFRVFDIIFVLTGGGPIFKTESLSILVNDIGYGSGRMGRATALSYFLIAIMVGFAFIYNKCFRIERE
jgi:multiple sugar transport system permease protein